MARNPFRFLWAARCIVRNGVALLVDQAHLVEAECALLRAHDDAAEVFHGLYAQRLVVELG